MALPLQVLQPQGEAGMENKKDSLITLALVLTFLTGLSLLLYPTISDWWNSFHQSQVIESFSKTAENLDKDVYRQVLNNADAYNRSITEHGIHWVMSEEEYKDYEEQLNVAGNGIMCYIEIPKINCELPVYHGVEDSVLQIAAGHIAGSSLPVGGAGTHCMISGHRGLPRATLFSKLDQLQEGDHFMLHTLNELLTYEIDQIRIVLPDELDDLQIVPGQDLCTLITCTPYGINSHRLLVRGHRTENDLSFTITAEARQVDRLIVASVVAAPILLVLLIGMLVTTGDRKRKKGKNP